MKKHAQSPGHSTGLSVANRHSEPGKGRTMTPPGNKTGATIAFRPAAASALHQGPPAGVALQFKIDVNARKLSGGPGRRHRNVTSINDWNALKTYINARVRTPLSDIQAQGLYGQLDGQTLGEKALIDKAQAVLHPRQDSAIDRLITRGDVMARALERETKKVEGVGRSTFVDGRVEMISFLADNFGALSAHIADQQRANRRSRMVHRAIQALFRAAQVIKENADILIDAGYLDRGDSQFRTAFGGARGIANRYGMALPSVDNAIRAPRPAQQQQQQALPQQEAKPAQEHPYGSPGHGPIM